MPWHDEDDRFDRLKEEGRWRPRMVQQLSIDPDELKEHTYNKLSDNTYTTMKDLVRRLCGPRSKTPYMDIKLGDLATFELKVRGVLRDLVKEERAEQSSGYSWRKVDPRRIPGPRRACRQM